MRGKIINNSSFNINFFDGKFFFISFVHIKDNIYSNHLTITNFKDYHRMVELKNWERFPSENQLIQDAGNNQIYLKIKAKGLKEELKKLGYNLISHPTFIEERNLNRQWKHFKKEEFHIDNAWYFDEKYIVLKRRSRLIKQEKAYFSEVKLSIFKNDNLINSILILSNNIFLSNSSYPYYAVLKQSILQIGRIDKGNILTKDIGEKWSIHDMNERACLLLVKYNSFKIIQLKEDLTLDITEVATKGTIQNIKFVGENIIIAHQRRINVLNFKSLEIIKSFGTQKKKFSDIIAINESRFAVHYHFLNIDMKKAGQAVEFFEF